MRGLLVLRFFCAQTRKKIVEDFSRSGYSLIDFSYYFDSVDHSEVDGVLSTYKTLPQDQFSRGNRYRSHSRYNWCAVNNVLVFDPSNDYFQSPSYNSFDGGKIRKFEMISRFFLDSFLVRKLLEKDTDIAKETNLVAFDHTLVIGLHQIRYRANINSVSYSSPPWLHKDDEPIVFVHVLNFTKNLVGGDNIIAKNGSDISRAIRVWPLQTLLLGQSVLHAVTPMSSADDEYAVRDILLVTFYNKKESPTLYSLDHGAQSNKEKVTQTEIGKNQNSFVRSVLDPCSSVRVFGSLFKSQREQFLSPTKIGSLILDPT